MSSDSQTSANRNEGNSNSSGPTEAESSADESVELNGSEKGARPVRRKKPNTRYTDLMSELETKRRRGTIGRRGCSPILKTDFQGGPGSFTEFNLARLQFARKSVLVGAVPQKLTSQQLANAPCTTQASPPSIQKVADASSSKDSSTAVTNVQSRPQRPVAYKRVVRLPDNTYQNPSISESTVQCSGSRQSGNIQAATGMETVAITGQVQEHSLQETAETKGNLIGLERINDVPQEHCYGKIPEVSTDQLEHELNRDIVSSETKGWSPLIPPKNILGTNRDQPQTQVATSLSEDAKMPYGYDYFTLSEEKRPERYQAVRMFPDRSIDFSFPCNDLPEELVDRKVYTSEKERQCEQ